MIYEIAHIAVIIATLLSAFCILAFAFNLYRVNSLFLDLVERFSLLTFFLILFGFFVLEYAFITSEFSVNLVAKNSHSSKPLIYKISDYGVITKDQFIYGF